MPDPGHALGADANDTFSPDEPPDDAIGRSCGGLTTKVHALTDELCSLNTVLLSAGQAGDNPMLWPLLEAHRTATRASFRLLGDKAFSHNSTRTRLRTMRIKHTIPEKSDQIAWRKARGPAGGRAPAFDPKLYCNRTTVERGVSRLKQWRGIATRNDKYALTYLGGVTLAAIVIYYRVRNEQTRSRSREPTSTEVRIVSSRGRAGLCAPPTSCRAQPSAPS